MAEAEACGLEPEALEAAKATLDAAAAKATAEAEQRLVERRLLAPAAELSFEVARSGLRAEVGWWGGVDIGGA